MKQLFDIVPAAEWPAQHGSVHQDVLQALAYLKMNPEDRVRVAAGRLSTKGKQHLIHEYAYRQKMRVVTVCRKPWVYFRLFNPLTDASKRNKGRRPQRGFEFVTPSEFPKRQYEARTPPKPYQATTAQEKRELERRAQ